MHKLKSLASKVINSDECLRSAIALYLTSLLGGLILAIFTKNVLYCQIGMIISLLVVLFVDVMLMISTRDYIKRYDKK